MTLVSTSEPEPHFNIQILYVAYSIIEKLGLENAQAKAATERKIKDHIHRISKSTADAALPRDQVFAIGGAQRTGA